MKATSFEFPAEAKRYGTRANPDPNSNSKDPDFDAFHKAVHAYLDSLAALIRPIVNASLNEERCVADERSRLPVYSYWWLNGDASFLQIDTRAPQIATGRLPAVISSEKNTTPERVAAIRQLSMDERLGAYCRAGRRNTRWSFLLVDVATTDSAPQQIADLLNAIHKIEETEFPATHRGRFR